MSTIKIHNNNNDEQILSIEEIVNINNTLSALKDTIKDFYDSEIVFLTIKDVSNITGWSKKTVEDLFNNPSFPSTNIGKTKLVLKPAFIKFFMTKRSREDYSIWKYSA